MDDQGLTLIVRPALRPFRGLDQVKAQRTVRAHLARLDETTETPSGRSATLDGSGAPRGTVTAFAAARCMAFPSDHLIVRLMRSLTGAQWARIEPLLPDRAPKPGGRWREHRQMIDVSACKWSLNPCDHTPQG